MNRRIFSLVCIALYALLDASIYCSQQKESGAKKKSVRGTKEINKSNDEDGKEYSGFNISKRTNGILYSKLPSDLSSDEMIKIFKDNHKDLPTDRLGFGIYIQNIFDNDPEQAEFLFKIYNKLSAQHFKFNQSGESVHNDYFQKFPN